MGFKKVKTLSIFSVLLSFIFLTGCAANRNIPLQANFWQNKDQNITIAAAKTPAPSVHEVGGQGLLDMAITNIANKSLSNNLKKTDLSWYPEMQQNFANRLKEKNIKTTFYTGALELNKKNQPNILAQTNGQLLLTFHLKAIGARREYIGGFIPKRPPEGYCVLVGELIEPNSKKVLWHHETEVLQKVQGKWDQPPHFQNFNQALSLAVADAKQELFDSFFSGQ